MGGVPEGVCHAGDFLFTSEEEDKVIMMIIMGTIPSRSTSTFNVIQHGLLPGK